MEPVARPQIVTVYADAVCDLFHHGHVEFFRRARELGDRLIVGILSDADCASYKPAPIMSHAERVAVVRGCRHVDQVLETPPPLCPSQAFLDAIGADICCHGDDMTQAELAYYYGDIIAGNRLRTVAYTARISTRDIIGRVVARARAGTLREGSNI